MGRFFGFYWLCILLISCTSKVETGRSETFIQNLDNGGYAVIPYDIVKGDTLFNGLAVYFGANGEKTDEIWFHNSVKDGPHKSFSEGKLLSIVPYNKGKENGIAEYFNGKRVFKRILFSDAEIKMVSLIDLKGNDSLINFVSKEDPYLIFQKNSESGLYVKEGHLHSDSIRIIDSKYGMGFPRDIDLIVPGINVNGYIQNLDLVVSNELNGEFLKVDRIKTKGDHRFRINFTQPGIYFLRLNTELMILGTNQSFSDSSLSELKITRKDHALGKMHFRY